jgi:aquaporin Z
MESACLGIFMVSAGLFTSLLEYPESPIRHAISNDFLRLALNGLGMGLTAIGIIYSPWGARSGAHMNPAVTWTFFRLGKVSSWDALFYPIFQTLGGITGVLLVKLVLGHVFTDVPVRYVVTVPGKAGVTVAFFAEMVIACCMMLMVLFVTNAQKLARFTGYFGGTLVFLYITFEAPLSGMSINPARTVASAAPSGVWTDAWIYFVAPIGGMLLAVELYHGLRRGARIACAKCNHDMRYRCIFCGHPGVQPQPITSSNKISTCRDLSFGIVAKNFLPLCVINLHRFVSSQRICPRFRNQPTWATVKSLPHVRRQNSEQTRTTKSL